MKTVFTIIKKEFTRFFKDPRLFFTTVFLPGLLIFVVYSLIGNITSSVVEGSAVTPTAYVVNAPASLNGVLNDVLDVQAFDGSEEQAKEQIKSGNVDVLAVFPEDFDAKVISQSSVQVSVYYDSTRDSSVGGYTALCALLSAYEQQLRPDLISVNAGDGRFDLAASGSMGMKILSMIVPMILLMMLFSGSIAVVLEAIAGEKERGTIATLLVTPIKRSHLAVGKILALSVIAMLSGLSSFLGIVFSLPQMLSGVEGLSLAMYGFIDYLTLLGVIISTVLILVSAMAIVSAFAKSVKEANALVLPLMIIVMLCGVVSMFAPSGSIGLFFIPVFNSALCISAVMSGGINAAMFLATFFVNVVFAALLVFILTLMFKSERIMFNK